MEQVRCESKSEIESIFVRLEMTQNVLTLLFEGIGGMEHKRNLSMEYFSILLAEW